MACFLGKDLTKDSDLGPVAKEKGIEFFLVSFVDIFGVLRSKMVPAAAISTIQKDGAGFAPFAAWLDYGPDAADMLALADPTTLIQVPFQKNLGFVIGDCYIEGQKVQDSPRWVLKDQIDKAAKVGYEFKTGVEAEFFLLSKADPNQRISKIADHIAISDPSDVQEKPCYDAQALMRRMEILQEIVKTLNECDYGVYQTDHEDANGQFEINWHYKGCLLTADQHVFFKYVVKSLAEKHGYRATFMPRPFEKLTGNGCHCHCSLWSGGKNIFVGGDGDKLSGPKADAMNKLGLSTKAWHFLGGVLAKAESFCAITNPSVNSYKRLNGVVTTSGSTWSPNRVSFSGNNRTHMVRVPEGDRFEVRLADGAANPYLLQAVILACGLEGMAKQIDPTPYFFEPTINMYIMPPGDPRVADIKSLPGNLLDAIRLFEKDADMRTMLGDTFVNAFLKLKYGEWREYTGHVSAWELEKTLDC
jgi:glutamine synthetase